MRTTYWILLAITVCGLAPPTAVAAGEAFKQETVLDSLHNPCGIAVRPPGGAELFVAESSAGRILRVKLSEPNKPETAIEGFPRQQSGNVPGVPIGPLGVSFLDRLTLVVGEGGQAKGADVVRIYQLPDDGRMLKHDQSKQVLGPIAAGKESTTGEGDFFAVATTSAALFIGGNGDDSKGWLLKADVAGGTASQLRPFIATKAQTNTSAPTALTISKARRIGARQRRRVQPAPGQRAQLLQRDEWETAFASRRWPA